MCLSSAASGSAHFLFVMLCLVLSRWRRTCALSSSRRMTSNRTLKGNGSSTLDTERTTSSPSFTEPSWSDIRFFILLLSTSPSPPYHLTTESCSSASLFLASADRNDQPPLPPPPFSSTAFQATYL